MAALNRWLGLDIRSIEDLALLETDPACYRRFTPITRGPIFAIGVLLSVGILAVFLRLQSLAARLSHSE